RARAKPPPDAFSRRAERAEKAARRARRPRARPRAGPGAATAGTGAASRELLGALHDGIDLVGEAGPMLLREAAHALELRRDLERRVRRLLRERAVEVAAHRLGEQGDGQAVALELGARERVGVAQHVGKRPVVDLPGDDLAAVAQAQAVAGLQPLLAAERIQVVGDPKLALLARDDGRALLGLQLDPREHFESRGNRQPPEPGRLADLLAAAE